MKFNVRFKPLIVLLFILSTTLANTSTTTILYPVCASDTETQSSYIKYLSDTGLDYECIPCTICPDGAYARQCSKFANAQCKEPDTIALDLLLVVIIYPVVHTLLICIYIVDKYYE